MNPIRKIRFESVMIYVLNIILVMYLLGFLSLIAASFIVYGVKGYYNHYIFGPYFQINSFSLFLFGNILFLVKHTAFIYVLYILRKIILTLASKHPFDSNNLSRTRTIGYVLILIGLSNLVQYMIILSIHTPKIRIMANPYGTYIGMFLFTFLGLIVLVMSKLFKFGVEMHKEQKLTI